MNAAITAWCHIKPNSIVVNGNTVIKHVSGAFAELMKDAYNDLEMSYPKFHKMDRLSKLGILAAEYCLKGSGFAERNDPSRTAIVLSNHAASLDTDRLHQQSISDPEHYLPSPAVFVYTLPNIVTGEIAIRHKITGENAFFVCDGFDAALLCTYTLQLLQDGAAGSALGGWVNDDNGNFEAFFYLAEVPGDSIKNANFKALNRITLHQLYND